ncbi:amino acid adenylation domain-containing protein [Streptomyces sp. NPDC012935]|uniref:amino acid adenylation domain-containing protein n=1 Tax=Streptomyces sp. NPDC012935 TaxID=3364857 RepID=UPI0036D02E6B
MSVEELLTELRAAGVELYEEGARLGYRAPKGALTAERLDRLREAKDAVLARLRGQEYGAVLAPDPDGRHEDFPLTDVQSAYLMGRTDAFDYGGVACHGYLEFALPPWDADRVEDAWNTLIHRHDMLRGVVFPEGHQRILPEVPRYRIEREDLRKAGPQRRARVLERIRGEMSHQVRPTDRWPLFEVRATRTDDALLLHLAVDLLICDYSSVRILLGQLHELCTGADQSWPGPSEASFRDYVLAVRRAREGARYQRDQAYWWSRIDALPPAPDLPLRTDSLTAPPRFTRHALRLTSSEWTALGRHATDAGATASATLLQAYAEAVGRWSRDPRFTLSLTVQSRLPLHPDVTRTVGDFSSVTVLEVDLTEGTTLRERIRGSQAQLWEDLDHRTCTGIEVLRELARRRGRRAALTPVTFTSTVGGTVSTETPLMPGARLVHGITQTPQVWLDCQVMEDGDALLVHWDVRDGVFPDGVAEDMFGAFGELVRGLAAGELWDERDPLALPARQAERLRRVNDTVAPLPDGPLHAGVVAQAELAPNRPAVITPGRTLDYGELLGAGRAVARALVSAGLTPGEHVGIVMDKGWEQIAGVLGVLLAGGVYLPVDTTQPPLRRDIMLRDAGVRHVLTQSWLDARAQLPPDIRTVEVDTLKPGASPVTLPETDPAAPAYVIYTSGSTGIPKGVVISHAAARNTVDDITARFGVGPQDRVLGLAQLGFDLSVYDIFGPLAVGGALVLPEAERRGDPAHWAALVAAHGVTLWNSVPAQLQMLEEYLRAAPAADPLGLRLALLSGDWVPVTLPDAARRRIPGLRVVSLGGATEAAIWSIHHPVEEVDPALRSIPYGRPLANQSFRVLDERMRDCPEHVIGELYIGGAGLALGYLGDPERTAERFVHHPHTGERLYRTGDLGRRMTDGEIEFLGRLDRQVKLNGHRVELAEVETALQTHPAVEAAAVVTHGAALARRLVGFVEPTRAPRPALPAAPRERAAHQAAEAVRGTALDLVPEAVELLDRSALQAMSRLLTDSGLFTRPGAAHPVEEIVIALRAAPQYEGLVGRWLRALERAGRITRDPVTGAYRDLVRVTGAEREAVRERLDALEPRVRWGAGLLRFHRDCEDRLAALLSAETDVKNLLFPNGRFETAYAAYRDSLISRYNNAAVAGAVGSITRDRQGAGPVRLLEVGAGTGATTAAVLPALAGLDADYLFTDVSHFFLEAAARSFEGDPRVRRALFDLNADYRAQGLRPNTFDVVVMANVLHDAAHVGEALRRVRELLAPGGWLVVIEATRESPSVMASMEFNAGLSGFRDERADSGQTFFGRDEWLGLLRAAGGEVAFCLPEEDEPLSRVGQHTIAARFKADRMPLDPQELGRHMAERLPSYMIPAELQIVDRLPLTGNGKTDRARLERWTEVAAQERASVGAEAPTGVLEEALAALWSEILPVTAVGRHDSFFELGGDSLLAAQLVGRMRERLERADRLDWDTLLRLVMNRPTIAELAARLEVLHARAGQEGGAGPTASPVVRIDGRPRTSAVPTWVVVHDGTGTLVPYRPLIEALSGTAPVLGLVLDDLDSYLTAEPRGLVGRMAAQYAEALLAEGVDRFSLVGYCMGGVLVPELATHLIRAGAEVADVSVISSYRVPYLVEDDLLAEYVFARLMRCDTTALGYPEDPRAMAELIASVSARYGDRLPQGSLAGQHDGPLSDAAAAALPALRALAGRSQQERLNTVAEQMPQEDAQLRSPERLARQYRTVKHSLAVVGRHRPTRYDGPLTLVRQVGEAEVFPDMHRGMTEYWRQVCGGEFRVVDVPGDHFECMRPPHVEAVARALGAVSAGPEAVDAAEGPGR